MDAVVAVGQVLCSHGLHNDSIRPVRVVSRSWWKFEGGVISG
jgi:hypothetical protein